MSRDFDWPEFLFLLGALRWTIVLSLIAFVGGGIGGLVLAIARTSSHAILRWIAATYIGLMQGTPVLMQLFLAYYGLAVLTGIRIDPWPARVACRKSSGVAQLERVYDPAARVGGMGQDRDPQSLPHANTSALAQPVSGSRVDLTIRTVSAPLLHFSKYAAGPQTKAGWKPTQ